MRAIVVAAGILAFASAFASASPGQPDGRLGPAVTSAAGKIALQGTRRVGGATRTEIYLVDGDGRALRRLSGGGQFSGEPTWSPDGSKIAFTSNRGSGASAVGNEIFVMTSAGLGARQLTFNSFEEHDPAWSPDGSQIAFAGERGVSVIFEDGGALREITAEVPLRRPTWAPNGRRVAFASGPNRTLKASQIYVVATTGAGLREVTKGRAGAGEPAWSPNGRRIAFVAGRPGDVYVIAPDGSQKRRLTRTAAPEWSPAWSPDGRRIVFARGSSVRSIFVMNSDESGVRRLVHRPGVSFDRPAWHRG